MPDQTPAQHAYAAYEATTGGLNYRGEPMPAWEQLGDTIQAAWTAAAAAILAAAAAQDVPAPCPHCPDGHADPTSGTWHARVAPNLDSDGQPTQILVARPAGQHVAVADAEWIRARLNPGAAS